MTHTVYAFILTAIAIVGIIVLAGMHITPPGVLDTVAGSAVGAGAALAIPAQRNKQ